MNGALSVSEVTFVAFDFETTGLYPANDRIVEFGAVKFTPGTELATFEELADPGIGIHPDAERVSGITNAMVAGKPPVEELLPRFMEFLGDAVLVAHNSSFDVGFLRAELQRCALPTVENTIIDTLKLAQRVFPGKKSYSLQNLVQMLGIPENTAHRGLDDSRQCMRLFERCVDEMSFMGELPLADVLT